jgi:hypothetical protein
MTRRSKISQTDDLLRSQRREVPNARMWSEAPVPPVAEWDGWLVEPGAYVFTEEEDW